jgi:hypothetical protein
MLQAENNNSSCLHETSADTSLPHLQNGFKSQKNNKSSAIFKSQLDRFGTSQLSKIKTAQMAQNESGNKSS